MTEKTAHAGHTSLDSHAWDEAKGQSVGFRQCSCGERLDLTEDALEAQAGAAPATTSVEAARAAATARS